MDNILYSFRRCPFAIRARWAILIGGKSVALREISLRDKPVELLNISSKATVPVLITEQAEIIEESLEIMKWAFKDSDQSPHIDYNSKIMIDYNDNIFKFHLDRYKYNARYQNEDAIFHRNKAREILEEWNSSMLKQPEKDQYWLTSKNPSFADFSIWPFVRQYRIADRDYFDNEIKLKQLKNWLFYFLNHNNYELIMEKVPIWKPGDKTIRFPYRYNDIKK